MYPVITISREFGSGGHSIGMAVAEKLGIPFLDSKIVEEVAKESGFAKDYVKEQDEMATYPELFITSNIFSTNYFDTPQEQIQQLQSEYIIEQAKKGPCVIAGRCADYVLENAGIPALNVFIHASMEYRKKRVLEVYGETDVKIEKRIEKKDKGRKSYYRYYTDRKFGDAKNYALCLISGILGLDKCIDFIIDVAENYNKD